jgi:hypothetical protein
MKIALIGASGMIGQRIAAEALSRGHEVTALVRDPSRIEAGKPGLTAKAADVTDAASVGGLVAGHDAVIAAYNTGADEPQLYSQVAHNLIAGLKEAGVSRLLVVGGAGSLEMAPGVQLVDTPEFPAAWKGGASALRDALEVYRQERELGWTFLCPAIMIQPGERTGVFRLGGDQVLFDAEGNSQISAEDYAVALVDELEQPKHIRQRFTVGY